MSFDDRLRHRITVMHAVPALDAEGHPVLDEYSQPTTAELQLAAVPGLVQPRTAREQTSAAQTGAVIGDYVGFLRPVAGLDASCWILDDHYPGVRFDVLSLPDAAGLGHHLELALKAVT